MIARAILLALTLASGPALAQQQTAQVCSDPRYRDPLSSNQDCDYSEFIRFCHGSGDCDKSEELVRSRRNPMYLAPKSQMPDGMPLK